MLISANDLYNCYIQRCIIKQRICNTYKSNKMTEKFKELVLSTGAFNPASSKGKWNMNAIKDFLKSQHKSNTEITVSTENFYKLFYNGSKEIKYKGYYSRTHVLDTLTALKIDGYCHQIKLDTGEVLKIGFKN